MTNCLSAGTAKKSELPSQIAFNAGIKDIQAKTATLDLDFGMKLQEEMVKAGKELGLRGPGAGRLTGAALVRRKRMLMAEMARQLEMLEPSIRKGMDELQLAVLVGMSALKELPERPE